MNGIEGCSIVAYSQHSEWRGRNDADYEASGGVS